MIPYKSRKTFSEETEWSLEKLLIKCQRYCASAERCSFDIKNLLSRYTRDEQMQESILHMLLDDNYVSDSRYAEAYVRDKIFFQQWGKVKIKQGLMLKQIPQDIINKVLGGIDENEYMEQLCRLVDKKKIIDENKLRSFLLQRGYSYEDIAKVRQNRQSVDENR